MTISAGIVVHSTPLTKFSVTGRYQVPLGVLRQHTTINMDENIVGRWRRRGSVVGKWWWHGGIGRWRWAAIEDAAVALGGSGGGSRRTCNIGIGISIVEAKGLL